MIGKFLEENKVQEFYWNVKEIQQLDLTRISWLNALMSIQFQSMQEQIQLGLYSVEI